MEVIIMAAGGHGRVVADILSMNPDYSVAGFTERDSAKHGTYVMGYPVLGDDDYIEEVAARERYGVILGFGQIKARERLLTRLEGLGLTWVNAIHPGACISRHARLGKGIVMVAGSIVNAMSEISDHSIINTNASVGHDCIIGKNVHVAAGCTVGGTCAVGDNTLLGLGCRIVPNMNIGEGSVVASGAVVVEDVPSGTVVMGVPARVVGYVR